VLTADPAISGQLVTTQCIVVYLKYQANKWVGIIPRLEYFNDRDGAPWATGQVQNLTDATVTLEVKPADNFIWRIEYRGDFSNKSPFFNDVGVPKSNQQMIVFGFLFNFSSKM